MALALIIIGIHHRRPWHILLHTTCYIPLVLSIAHRNLASSSTTTGPQLQSLSPDTMPPAHTESHVETILPDDPQSQRIEIEFSAADLESLALPRIPPPISCRSAPDTKAPSFFSDWLTTSTSKDDSDLEMLKLQATTEDDGSSVGSIAYFEPSDFKPTNWKMAMDAPTLGFAVLALTIGMVHPLMFVAGAITALGTATAVGAGLDVVMEGPIGRWLFCTSDTTTMPEKTHEAEDATLPQALEPGGVNSEIMSPAQSKERLASQSTLLSGTEQELPDNWLELNYPFLENQLVNMVEFTGLNVVQFFQVFFADNAPYNFAEFQKKRGDKHIEYSKWSELALLDDPVSLHPTAASNLPSDFEYRSYRGRTLHFEAKTNSLFGPPFAKTTKTQRILVVSKRLAVLESRTDVQDIPFADRFFVIERWVMQATKGATRQYTATLCASSQIFFVKSCPFEGQIRTKSKEAVTDVAKKWCAMAQEALKLTEQTKKVRLQREKEDDDLDDTDHSTTDVGADLDQDESYAEEKKEDDLGPDKTWTLDEAIEVTHTAKRVSSIVGENTQIRLGGRRNSLSSFRRSVSGMMNRRRSTTAIDAIPAGAAE